MSVSIYVLCVFVCVVLDRGSVRYFEVRTPEELGEVRVCVCMHAYMNLFVCVRVYLCICMCVYIYIYIYIYILCMCVMDMCHRGNHS